MRQVRPGDGATTRISDHSGEITDNENCLMAEVLKLPQFSQNDRVPKVNVRGGRIHAELYPQRPTE